MVAGEFEGQHADEWHELLITERANLLTYASKRKSPWRGKKLPEAEAIGFCLENDLQANFELRTDQLYSLADMAQRLSNLGAHGCGWIHLCLYTQENPVISIDFRVGVERQFIQVNYACDYKNAIRIV